MDDEVRSNINDDPDFWGDARGTGRAATGYYEAFCGVRASEPLAFLTVSAILVGVVALAACYLPLRRAACP